MHNDDVMGLHKHLMPNEGCHELMGKMMPKGKGLASNINADMLNGGNGATGLPDQPNQFPYDQRYDMRNSQNQTKINNNYM